MSSDIPTLVIEFTDDYELDSFEFAYWHYLDWGAELYLEDQIVRSTTGRILVDEGSTPVRVVHERYIVDIVEK